MLSDERGEYSFTADDANEAFEKARITGIGDNAMLESFRRQWNPSNFKNTHKVDRTEILKDFSEDVESEEGSETKTAMEKQVGGNHYKDMKIQPSYFCYANNVPWLESNVIKYTCRHRNKNGRQDIEKAIHYLQMLLEWEYDKKID